MTELDLAAIRARYELACAEPPDDDTAAIRCARSADDVPDLLAKIEALQDRNRLLDLALDDEVAEVERLSAAVALHKPRRDGRYCRDCEHPWPCPTARAAGVE